MIVWTALIGLTSYRLWRLLAEDDITEPIRERLPDWKWLSSLIECGWCGGSWVAFGVTWASDATVGVQAPVLVGLAAAVVVGWLGEHL